MRYGDGGTTIFEERCSGSEAFTYNHGTFKRKKKNTYELQACVLQFDGRFSPTDPQARRRG
jgi:hypothetical protein